MSTEPTHTDAICVRFPTIMSGVVLRWYADEAAFEAGRELANAGREEACVLLAHCSERVRDQAVAAHKAIRDAYRSGSRDIDTSRWETHRQPHFGSHELVPVAARGWAVVTCCCHRLTQEPG